jgi:serine phosphatase RsbU (regulator of sigma subunit)
LAARGGIAAMRSGKWRVQPVPLLPGDRLVFVTDGVLERNAATADVIGLVAASSDLHPREVVQELTRAVLRAVDGKLRDDATALCLDWYRGGERDRQVDAGANQHGASPPRADS